MNNDLFNPIGKRGSMLMFEKSRTLAIKVLEIQRGHRQQAAFLRTPKLTVQRVDPPIGNEPTADRNAPICVFLENLM
jgi:hypothetical protein